MNATRYEIAERLGEMGLPVSVSHGGVTRANRVRLALDKDHYIDALCVGDVAERVSDATNGFLPVVESPGRGSHQRSKPVFFKPCWACGKTFSNAKNKLTEPKSKAGKRRNKFCPSCREPRAPVDNGHRRKTPPVRFYTRRKPCYGFSTGDLVEAKVPSGKKKGTYAGRMGMRASASFKITVGKVVIDGINHRHRRLLERGNGWSVSMQRRPVLLPALTDGAFAPGEAR